MIYRRTIDGKEVAWCNKCGMTFRAEAPSKFAPNTVQRSTCAEPMCDVFFWHCFAGNRPAAAKVGIWPENVPS